MVVTSETELAEFIRDASGPLAVRGGGTRPIGKPVAGEAMSVRGMDGIALYEPGALTIVLRPGTPIAEVTQALAAEGQMLPFEPMDHRALLGTEGVPTIGGVVAANVSGPRRVTAGACRDSLIGVRFVDGTGAVVRNGGRVMKNVTGYDLVKLMAGSFGTLGVLSEVAFKVLPVPEAEVTLTLEALAPEAAVAAMSAALGSPYGVSGAAREVDGRVLIRVEGLSASVAHRSGALHALLSRHGAVGRIERDESKALWVAQRDVTAFRERPGDVWRVSVKPSDASALIGRINAPALMDWGGGLVWLCVSEGCDLRAQMGETPGHATLIRASAATRASLPVFHPEPAPLARIAAGLRAKFDPRGVLNPGLMG